MASFSTIPVSYPPPLKDFIHWGPAALEPKAKSKAKAKEKPKTTECNLKEDGSHGYEGDWADIGDFLTGPSLRSLAIVGATLSLGSRHLGISSSLTTNLINLANIYI